MRLIRSAPGSWPDNIMSRYKIKIFLEIRGWAWTIWLDKCGVEQPSPLHLAIIEINTIFSIIYIIRKSNADLPWAILIETRRFFIYIFIFFLFTRHYKRGRETYRYYGFSVDELDLSYNFHIRGEKYLSKIFEYFNALRPLIFELLQMQYLFRIDFWIFFIVKNENLVIFVYMYKMTKENCISEETNCPILTV